MAAKFIYRWYDNNNRWEAFATEEELKAKIKQFGYSLTSHCTKYDEETRKWVKYDY